MTSPEIWQGRFAQTTDARVHTFASKTFDQSLSVGNVQTHGMQSRLYYSLREKMGR